MATIKFEASTPDELQQVAEMAIACRAILVGDDGEDGTADPSTAVNQPEPNESPEQQPAMDLTGEEATTPVDLDADGIPWDTRIHSSSRKKNEGDGRWKRKRGIDKAVYDQVVAELKELMSIEAPAAPAPASQAPAAPAPASQAPAAPAPASQAPDIDIGVADPEMTFPSVIRAVNNLVNNGQLTMPQFHEIHRGVGVQDAALLANRADLLPEVWKLVKQQVANHG